MDFFAEIAQLRRTGDYLILLLRAALYRSDPPGLPEGLSWRQVYQLAKFHGMETMALAPAEARVAREDADLFRQWDRRRTQNLIQSLTQRAEHQAIAARFGQAGIPLVPLKGQPLSRLYPQWDFRQMTDLDYLVPEADLDAAAALLEEMGYRFAPEEAQADFHVTYQKPPYVTVELHPHLLPARDPGAAFFSSVWERVTAEEAGGLSLSGEDSYLFLAAHMAKHFFTVGSGIRSVLDVYLLRAALEDAADWRRVEAGLREMGLLPFLRRIEALGRDWFSPDAPPARTGRARVLEQEIFAAGAHGSLLSRPAAAAGARFEGRPRLWNLLCFTWRRVFIGRDYLVRDYPALGRFPFLLPVCWMRRLIRQLFSPRHPALPAAGAGAPGEKSS